MSDEAIRKAIRYLSIEHGHGCRVREECSGCEALRGLRDLIRKAPPEAAAWVPCECCGEWSCAIHGQHVYECPCLPIEYWSTDPYQGRPASCSCGGATEYGPPNCEACAPRALIA